MHQYKLSEDLEMYEMDYANNTQLQEVCDVRQPIMFLLYPLCPRLFDDFCKPWVLMKKYGSYDLQIKDMGDYFSGDGRDLGSVPMPLSQTLPLIEQDIKATFVSSSNGEFLEETGLLGHITIQLDPYLKPTFTVHSRYDMMFGSCGTVTPFQYHNYYRRFLCVTSGKIRLKMSPWNSSKYMHAIKDYEHYEFRSPVHPTGPSPEYQHDYDRMNFLEFDVDQGYAVHIPPYWWYSIEYVSTKNGANSVTTVCSVSYMSVMNMVANIPDIALYWLQQQNITHKVGRTLDPVKNGVSMESPVIEPPIDEVLDKLERGEAAETIVPFAQEKQHQVQEQQDIETQEKEAADPQNIVSV